MEPSNILSYGPGWPWFFRNTIVSWFSLFTEVTSSLSEGVETKSGVRQLTCFSWFMDLHNIFHVVLAGTGPYFRYCGLSVFHTFKKWEAAYIEILR